MSIGDVLTSSYFVRDPRRATWRLALGQEFDLPYMRLLRRKLLREEREGHSIYPAHEQIYAALTTTALPDVKVVIVGQDPYPQSGRAHGLAFSVANGDTTRSLTNVIAEVRRNMGGTPRRDAGCLIPWAEQGVLLLNATLTVRAECAKSHVGWGWECFTTRIIQAISQCREHVVFMLWGEEAQRKAAAIDYRRHKLLIADHPRTSTFCGCRHFSRANGYLSRHRLQPVDWLNMA